MAQGVRRVLIYILGLFLLSFGGAMSINSGLGVAPVNSLPYVMSCVTGLSMGVCAFSNSSTYIALQVLILRRDYQVINLLQLVFALIFGNLVNFSRWILGSFSLPTYFGQLAMLAVSMLTVAVGVLLCIEVKLVPMPMEGLALALTQKTKKPFPAMKVAVDSVVVAAAIGLSLFAFRGLVGIREGTVIAALCTGRLIALLRKPIASVVQGLCFPAPEAADAVS